MASQETFRDHGCSSPDEYSSSRGDSAEGTLVEKTSPVAHRHHPFSVEAIMSGRSSGGGSARCKPEGGSVSALSSLYLLREACSPPMESRKNLMAAPSSPVKSETESEDCAPWVTTSAFSSQPRKFIP